MVTVWVVQIAEDSLRYPSTNVWVGDVDAPGGFCEDGTRWHPFRVTYTREEARRGIQTLRERFAPAKIRARIRRFDQVGGSIVGCPRK